jgi:hypothetical protein
MVQILREVCSQCAIEKYSSTLFTCEDQSAFISQASTTNGESMSYKANLLNNCTDSSTIPQDTGEDTPMAVNFRYLLWYWNEYYLRRGRDRLSLEFSSHIPFSYWRKVTGMLIN